MLLVSTALALVVSACLAPQTPQSITGVLVEVDAGGLTQVSRFAVRDANGTTWTFRPAENAVDEDGRPLNASHLREHMLGAEQITVDYRREGDTLVAQRMTHH